VSGPVADAGASDLERRVLLFVATRKDAEVTVALLKRAGLACHVCDSIDSLLVEIRQGAAAILATEAIADRSGIDLLLGVLESQEEWSDLPVVILLAGGVEAGSAEAMLRRLSNVTILERPASLRSVASAVQAAVRARIRQYHARAQLRAIREAEAKARSAEATARRANEAKDEFLASLSHELRTPLTPVLLLATELAGDGTLPDAVRADFDFVAKNIGLEARLIDDLLDLTRIAHGKMKLEFASHDAMAVVRDALRNVQPELADKHFDVATQLAADPAPVRCDATRLQQAVWNVLRNAAKFTPAGGRIRITARVVPECTAFVLEVVDSGIGMTPDELQRAFDVFAQGNHAKDGGSRQFGGLGLGLAITRSIVEQHGGTIQARSDGPGRGAAFTITLPLLLAAGSPLAEPAGRTRGSAHPVRIRYPFSILLVEDHAPTREALKRLLATRTARVSAAATMAEARRLSAAEPFDVLMTDIGLPDGDGYALMRELTLSRRMPAVALTGYGMDEDVARSRKAGFLAHLTKPLRAADLDAVLGKVAAAVPVGGR
jgi:signal transduction histidine kinase